MKVIVLLSRLYSCDVTDCCWLGTIHCITTSPDGHIIGVGYTSGVLSTLDLRTGLSVASWKAHEADIVDVMYCAFPIIFCLLYKNKPCFCTLCITLFIRTLCKLQMVIVKLYITCIA